MVGNQATQEKDPFYEPAKAASKENVISLFAHTDRQDCSPLGGNCSIQFWSMFLYRLANSYNKRLEFGIVTVFRQPH